MTKINVLLGMQWGDEGKGKIVDVITPEYEIIARFQGGPNAGHTLEFNGIKHVLHTIPSGIFRDNCINIIGNGVVVDPVVLKKELDKLTILGVDFKSKLYIAKKAQLILPSHKCLDAASEQAKGKSKIGSTLKGIGPTYMDKTGRNGLRVGDILSLDFLNRYTQLLEKHLKMLAHYEYDCDLSTQEKEWFEAIEFIKQMTLIDGEIYLNKALGEGKKILAEGAQGSLLDIDFGTYPFVTSSNTVSAGACTGLGVSPDKITGVFGIFKAYATRVGSGPFPTELNDATGELIRKIGNEFGSTTGRPRRCGWLDLVALKYTAMINGVTEMYMMKADVLSGFDTLQVCTTYKICGEKTTDFPYDMVNTEVEPIYESLPGWKEDLTQINDYKNLPENLKKYIQFIENYIGIPIKIVSVGPNRMQTIIK
jgi:adenylosuccinate synthase